jgi:omega-amidase
MESKIKVTLIQSYLFWEDTKKNLQNFESKILSINQKTDLVVLPEMFNTSFSFNVEKLAESMHGTTINWMKKLSQKLDCVITGSLMIKENQEYFNRLVWVKPSGGIEFYDKKHLFSLSEEPKFLKPGTKKALFQLKEWKISPIICYDLRFPVWCRNVEDYDILLVVASWPESRSSHWRTLLQARAMENQSYVIGVNRVGEDGKNIYHSGDSMLIHPSGNILFQKMDDEDIYTATIQKVEVTKTRKIFPFLADRDQFAIE